MTAVGPDRSIDRVERLQTMAGDVDDDALVRPHDTLRGKALEGRDRDAAGGLGEDPSVRASSSIASTTSSSDTAARPPPVWRTASSAK